MVQTMHPPVQLATELRNVVDSTRDAAAAARRLPDELVDEIRRRGGFALSTPVELGGHEAPLALQTQVYEALGRLDGPVAWNVWNGNLGFSAALLDERAVGEIWDGTGDPFIANSARVTGSLAPVDGGYVLHGRWDIVSGIDNADWVALFAIVLVDGAPRMHPHGAPDVRCCYLRRADVQVLDTWHTTGMRATGSNSVVVDGVEVPERRAIDPFAPARVDRPLYRLPAFTLASSGVAPIVVGMARAALDELIGLAATKPTDTGQVLAERSHAQHEIGRMHAALDAATLLLLDATGALDAAAIDGRAITGTDRARLRAAMSHAGEVSRDVFSTCHRLAGTSAIVEGSAIERIVRDGTVATQHALLSPTHLDLHGRLLLGLPAGTPVF